MNGYQTTELIFDLVDKQIIQRPIIVACTAYSDIETKNKCYQIGMSYFLNKPVQIDLLKQCIADLALS